MAISELRNKTQMRIRREFQTLINDPPPGVNAVPYENDWNNWIAVIFGPENTVWEGGVFELNISIPENYPDKPPVVKFITEIFHPNVYADGLICIDILQKEWSPIYDISGILTSIRSLLSDPNPSSPANGEAATLYVQSRREYERCVAKCVEASLANVKI